jgi:hypothetical protein
VVPRFSEIESATGFATRASLGERVTFGERLSRISGSRSNEGEDRRDLTSQEAGMRADLVIGGHLPDLELPDHRREPVRLSELAAGYPLIVSFYRGYW